MLRRDIPTRFSEMSASELPEIYEEMCLRYHMLSDIPSMLNYIVLPVSVGSEPTPSNVNCQF